MGQLRWAPAGLALLLLTGCGGREQADDARPLSKVTTEFGDSNRRTQTVTISAGKATRIAGYSDWDNGCFGRIAPKVIVTRPPEHGTIQVKTGTNKIEIRRLGSNDCTGRDVYGSQIVFTPAAGYSGQDYVVLAVEFLGGAHVDRYDLVIAEAKSAPVVTQ